MLFVAEYTFAWEALATVAAKRLEWDHAQPDGFRFVGEWVWKEATPAFRGFAVIEADDLEALNAFALHYGATVTMAFRPATDVVSGLAQVGANRPGGKRRARR